MNTEKVEQPRKKLSLINYKIQFNYGDQIPVFVIPSKSVSTESASRISLLAEVNPFYKARISFGEANDELKIDDTKSMPELESSMLIDESPRSIFDPNWYNLHSAYTM